MDNKRIIARLDVKPPYVIKGVHYDGLRKIGKPEDLAAKYYAEGADEIIYIDTVASLYRREIIFDLIEKTAEKVLVPFCVGGGIKSLDDMAGLFHRGADKVAVNTYAIKDPTLISSAAKVFGSQSVVLSIQAKRRDGWWECFTDSGRIPSGKDAVEWAREAEKLGAGEILLTSVDADGRRRGFDLDLVSAVRGAVGIPVIAAGGAGRPEHVSEVLEKTSADAAAIATILHYGIATIGMVKECVKSLKGAVIA